MDVKTLLQTNFKNNLSVMRNLTENNQIGLIGAGFIRKNLTFGSHIQHTPPNYSCLLILSGEGTYIDDQFHLPLKPGDFVQRYPNHTHSTLVTTDDWEELYIIFGAELYDILVAMNVISSKRPVLQTGLDFDLIEQMISFYDKLSSLDAFELPLLLSDAIAITSRAHYLDKLNTQSCETAEALNISCRYMTAHIHERPPLEEVADHIHMGYEKFRKSFSHHFGISPGYYMIQKRIHLAQKQLSDPAKTVKEIALELGYSDAFTFSKQFKKLTGVSPSEFRALFITS